MCFLSSMSLKLPRFGADATEVHLLTGGRLHVEQLVDDRDCPGQERRDGTPLLLLCAHHVVVSAREAIGVLPPPPTRPLTRWRRP